MSESTKNSKDTEKKEPVVGFHYTNNLPELLHGNKFSMFISTYQAGRVMMLSSNGQKISMLMRSFQRPTGIALHPKYPAIYCKNHILFFEGVHNLLDEAGNVQPYDICYTPRKKIYTGDLAGHEMAWIDNTLVFVNTRFSCLARLDEKYSFVPVWKPPFITEVTHGDRCHLNGMAIENGKIRFVTALGETNSDGGWRDKKASGGVVVDVNSGKTVIGDLSMPHSPRLYGNKLWVLDSGRGSFKRFDNTSFKLEAELSLPGFLRGLSFFKNLAFVGLCKIREKNVFGGLPVESMHQELLCAVAIVDILTMQQVGFIEFTKGIEELFDIHIMPWSVSPHILGFEENTIDGVFILP